ncbi:IS110 family transposase [Reichenbachiella sp.]|uniref:IS110 family transposase n=1 Tax=Reichenbachiella sp. TaxID=2184521 RepID=UPI003B5BEA8A
MDDLSKYNLFIGIDVHKRNWSVSIFSASIHHRTFSQPPHPEALKSYIDKHFKEARVICAYEASKLGFWIFRVLERYGYRCLVVNPADIPTTNKESSEKTDPVDSRKIAKALRAGLLRGIYVPQVDTEGDRQLFRYRKKLWGDLVRIKNRIKDKFLFAGIDLPKAYDNAYWSKPFLAWIPTVQFESESTKLTVDFLLEQYHFVYAHFLKTSIAVRRLQRQAKYKTRAKLLRGIPGIGPLTTVQLLTEIEDINRYPNFKHFNGFVGLKPMTHSSGERDLKGYMTYRRHNALRSSLIECAWSSVQKDPAMLIRYEQLLQNHTKKRAIVIIARKLLSRIYHVLKTGEAYEVGLVK